MKFDKLLKAIATLDKPQLRQISDAVLEHHRYLNHDPLVYGVKRRMADHTVHYRVTDPIAVWGEGVHHPRLWLVPDLEVAKTEAIIRGGSHPDGRILPTKCSRSRRRKPSYCRATKY